MTQEHAERLGDVMFEARVNTACEIYGLPPAFPETAAALAEPRRNAMTVGIGSCPRCGAAWTFGNGSWLWNERSGATHLLKEYGNLDDEGRPPPLKRCPCCRWGEVVSG